MKRILAFAFSMATLVGLADNVPAGTEVTYNDGDSIPGLTVYGTVYIKGGSDQSAAAGITVYNGGKVYMSGGSLTHNESTVMVKRGGYFEQTGGTINVNYFKTESENDNDAEPLAKFLGGTFKTHARNNNGAFYPTGGKVLFKNATLGDANGVGNFFPAADGTKPWGALSDTAGFENDIRLENITFENGVFSPSFRKGTYGSITGRLTVVDSTYRSEPYPPNASENVRTSYVIDNSKACFRYGYSFPNDFATAWADRTYVPPANAWHELVITNGADVIMSSTVYDDKTCDWWTLSDVDAVKQADNSVKIGAGELRVEGGRLVTDVQMCPGGRLVLNGGKLVARTVSSHNGMTSENYILNPGCDIYLNGGELLLPYYKSSTPNWGTIMLGDNSSGAKYNHGWLFPITVHQNGSTVTMSADNGKIEFGAWNSHPGTARWEYRSGSFSSDVFMYTQISNVMEVAKIGSAQSPRIKYIDAEATWGAFNKAVCEFVLDKSPAHISPWIFTDSKGRRFGSLRIMLDGGVMVTKQDTFDLITLESGTMNSSGKKTYYDLPDASLWTEQLSADSKTSQVKLTAALDSASAKDGVSALATPKALGSVTMTGVRTDEMLRESYIDLALQDTQGDALSAAALAELSASMKMAGYTNSAVIADGAYNLRVAIPADALQSGDLRFVWDFTKRPGAWALATAEDVVTEKARVSALRFSENRKKGFAIILR